jgi:bifunctional ADP-heptose synthase (sugar kinase/adenylyltransferase)
MMDDLGIGRDSVLEEPDLPTIVKIGAAQCSHRGVQQMIRFALEDSTRLDSVSEAKLLDTELDDADGVLICDINKGILTLAYSERTDECSTFPCKPVVIDPRRCDNVAIYRGTTELTPN